MLTQKTRYAILAMTRLAREQGQGLISINDISQSENIPKKFLEGILLELKKLGFLGSKLGKQGGYHLIKSPEEVNLLDIVRHFEGSIALLPCTSEKYYEACEHCKDEQTCQIRTTFNKIRDYTYVTLQKTNLAIIINA